MTVLVALIRVTTISETSIAALDAPQFFHFELNRCVEGDLMRIPKSLRILGGVAVVAALGAGAFFTRERWMPLLVRQTAEAAPAEDESPPVEEPKVLKLSSPARKNMGLVSKSVRPQTYWKKVQIPGEIVDRPGRSDRGITSPAVGVVTQIHAFPGDTVKPGDRLFTLRLFSEYLQNTQKELFGATRVSLRVKTGHVFAG